MAKNHKKNKKGHGRVSYHQLMREIRKGGKPTSGKPPPYLSFDPSIEAERRAAQRGLLDTLLKTKVSGRRAKQDKRGQLKDIRTTKKRGRQDITRDFKRSKLSIQQNRQDVKLKSARGQQDFGLQLQALTRHYTVLGRQQEQAANAAGVLDEGTAAASASARATNKRIQERPIHIGQRRLRQDTGTALNRLQIQGQQLRQDRMRGITRLRQDARHDIHLARQDYRRTIFDLHTSLQQAIREQRIGDADLIQQEIYGARANHLGSPGNYPGVKKGPKGW